MPVVDYYRSRGKVVEVDSSPPVDEVYEKVRVAMDERLATSASQPPAIELGQPIGQSAGAEASV